MSRISALQIAEKIPFNLSRFLVNWRGSSYLLPLLLLLIWQGSSVAGVLPAAILPAPSTVVTVATQLIASGELFRHLGVSALRAFSGLALGGSIAFALGLLSGLSPTWRRLIDPTLQMVRTVPHLALIPLIILWLGVDEPAKIVLVAWGVFFPIYVNTFHGVFHIDKQLVEMGQVYNMGRNRQFFRIVLPSALPSILSGLRYSLGVMWLTLIVAETIAASSGIGYMANQAREFGQTDVIVLTILLYALLGKLADSFTRALEHRWLRWIPAIRED